MRKTPSILVGIVLVLLALGIVILASASSVKGDSARYRDAQYFLKRQLLWLAVALAAGFAAFRIDYRYWQRYWVPIGLLALLLLAAVLVPGIGVKKGGSYRWLYVGPIGFQPSEFGKFATVICLSAWAARVGRRMTSFGDGLVKPLLALGVCLALVLKEPDYGTTFLIAAVGVAMLYAGGSRWGYLLVAGILGTAVFTLAVLRDPVRTGRILAFLMPDKYPDVYYQIGQSKDAFVLGGLRGVGLGESIQKHYYLPEAHTDFILAIIGEELGLPATGLVALLFAGLLVCGLMISLAAPDLFGRLVAFGITLTIVLQAAINIGVVTGSLPTKGLPLPFISYGGTSLVMSLVQIGVLLNVARRAAWSSDDRERQAVRDRTQWL